MTTYKIALGTNAYSFNDQATGITLGRGDVVELTPAQFSNKRIQRALVSGHLRQVMEPKDPRKYTDADILKLDKKLRKLYDKGTVATKAAGSFSLEEAELIAKHHDIEKDAEDTVSTLIEAVYETYGSES